MLASLRQLEAFRAVVVAGSVTGAAEMLGVSQPAISRLVADLEAGSGCRLFTRHRRRLILTPEGAHLLRDVENALTALDKMTRTAEALRGLRAGHLSVASVPALSHHLLPELVRDFLDGRPGISLSLQVRNAPKVVELLANSQVDLAVAAPPYEHPAIEVTPLPATDCVCVLPQGHRLARRRVVRVQDLHGETFVSITKDAFLRYRIDEAFDREGVVRHLAIETPMGITACALVKQGLGVSVVDCFSAAHFARRGVVAKPLEPRVPYEIAIAFPRHAARSRLAEAFAAELKKRLRAAAASQLVAPRRG